SPDIYTLSLHDALPIFQRDTLQLDVDAVYLPDGAQDRLDPLRRRVAPEHERTDTVATAALGAGELVHVDTVPDRPHLRRLEREGTPVDTDDRGREPLGDAQLPGRLPVRVPEQQRNAARTHERRGDQHVQRDHV